MNPRRALAPVAAAVAFLVAACGSPEAPAASDGPTIVTSTDVYGSVARAVGGDLVEVKSLLNDPSADPHSYESTPTDALAVADADVVVLNGGGYDEFMSQLVGSTDTGRSVIDVSALSGLEPAAASDRGEFNEHVWYSLPTVRKLATRLAADLAAVDPSDAARYTANAEAFSKQVAGLIGRVQSIGTPGTRVAVTEPVPGYLIEQAGLVDATPEEFAEAVEEDSDPPAAVVQETLTLFTGPDPVRALIVNSQTRTPTTDQVRAAAEAAGVPVVTMSETLPEGQADYVSWMSGQIDALTAALARGRTS
jgi:zinc/manganese transport system substrate-binding protein